MATTLADIRTSAGTTIGISAAQPATYTEAGFEALTFTDIAFVSDIPEFGKSSNLVTFTPLATRNTVKRKGSIDFGSVTMEMARVPADPGQTLLRAANDSDLSYSFKVETQDGTVTYFSAQVMSYTTNISGVDDITMASVQMEIDNFTIEVPPTP